MSVPTHPIAELGSHRPGAADGEAGADHCIEKVSQPVLAVPSSPSVSDCLKA